MRIIQREDYTRMPWKNGKGLTEEIMAFPVGSTMETFDWRLSIAHVGEDGPFSLFPGVDRSIALLDGEGLRLDLPDGDSMVLAPYGQPFAFAGEWAISSTNLGGPTIDLNIMTRRGRYQHSMRRHHGAGPLNVSAKTEMILVFETAAVVEASERAIDIPAFSSVMLNAGEHISIIADDMLHLLMIELQPIG
ncbi:HutD/Ves family protein [Rhizobium oryziradicis]|uniref:HutD-family protein n=1 Tax=Rhizobium oryziradicis TaxID=1867956 RepID=A0A1Q8ZWY0_9HYPH|nr:HutD family protein [Rhizobium oryziradicis]OLP46595.1 hypothetical protein BJF95_16560 [Rhizobium oryziradicis]